MSHNLSLAIAAAPMSLEDKLGWHLLNFAPQPPKAMTKVWLACITAFDLGMPETTNIGLPEGSTFQGKPIATIADVIEGYHLEYYLASFAIYLPASPLDAPLDKDTQTVGGNK